MALLDVPATKSGLLAVRRQLDFAQEGYALLDQKRELLLLELAARAGAAAAARREAEAALERARAALREAALDSGGAALDRAALAVRCDHQVELRTRKLVGLEVTDATVVLEPLGARFGTAETSPAADQAARAFAEVLPLLAVQAGLEASVARLARELKRTQRRCSALSKKVIPDCLQTIAFLASALEERERESFVILKMVRNRLLEARRESSVRSPLGVDGTGRE